MTSIFKDLLLVSGSGQNVGKTTFICGVIAQNVSLKVAAIKITPHFHEATEGLIPIVENRNFRIFQETDYFSEKDTSRYLQAGAQKAYFIQTTDAFLEKSFKLTSALLSPDQPFIVESAALRFLLVPELFVYIQGNDPLHKPSAMEMRKLADSTVMSDGLEFNVNPRSVYFNKSWKIETHDYS